jgi:hypothetical protein
MQDHVAALHHCFGRDFRNGSIPAAEFSDRHGRTCFNTGRQGAQPLCSPVIGPMVVATKGNRHARSTPESRCHGRRPWIPRWARTCLPRCKKDRGTLAPRHVKNGGVEIILSFEPVFRARSHPTQAAIAYAQASSCRGREESAMKRFTETSGVSDEERIGARGDCAVVFPAGSAAERPAGGRFFRHMIVMVRAVRRALNKRAQ